MKYEEKGEGRELALSTGAGQIGDTGVHPIGVLKQPRFPRQVSRSHARMKARVVLTFLMCPAPGLGLSDAQYMRSVLKYFGTFRGGFWWVLYLPSVQCSSSSLAFLLSRSPVTVGSQSVVLDQNISITWGFGRNADSQAPSCPPPTNPSKQKLWGWGPTICVSATPPGAPDAG